MPSFLSIINTFSLSLFIFNVHGYVFNNYKSSRRIPLKVSTEYEILTTKILENIEPHRSGMVTITDELFNTEILTATGLRVAFFTSQWCGPCRNMQIVLEETAALSPTKSVSFYSIDTDENPISAAECQVRSIPSTILFKNGQVVADIVGTVPRDVLMGYIQKHCSSY